MPVVFQLQCSDQSVFGDPHEWQYCENNLTLDNAKATALIMEMKLIWNGNPTAQTDNADYDEISWVCTDCSGQKSVFKTTDMILERSSFKTKKIAPLT